MTKLTLERIVIEDHPNFSKDYEPKAFVFGWQFGPTLLVVTNSVEAAFHIWDEECGQRVDYSDRDLQDYGDTLEERVSKAMDDGDIRTNDGGTTVWVDHYEWFRAFDTVKEAGAYFRGTN